MTGIHATDVAVCYDTLAGRVSDVYEFSSRVYLESAGIRSLEIVAYYKAVSYLPSQVLFLLISQVKRFVNISSPESSRLPLYPYLYR